MKDLKGIHKGFRAAHEFFTSVLDHLHAFLIRIPPGCKEFTLESRQQLARTTNHSQRKRGAQEHPARASLFQGMPTTEPLRHCETAGRRRVPKNARSRSCVDSIPKNSTCESERLHDEKKSQARTRRSSGLSCSTVFFRELRSKINRAVRRRSRRAQIPRPALNRCRVLPPPRQTRAGPRRRLTALSPRMPRRSAIPSW